MKSNISLLIFRIQSDKHIEVIKRSFWENKKPSNKSESSISTSNFEDSDKNTKESKVSPKKSNVHHQNKKLIRKISIKVDDILSNNLLSPLLTMGSNFRRKSPMNPFPNSDVKIPFYWETIHENNHSNWKEILKKQEQKFSRISTCFSPSEGSTVRTIFYF